MGRGGHHFSGRHHYRHHGSSSDMPISVLVTLLIVTLSLYWIFSAIENDNIRGGEKISGNYTLTKYLYDDADYFENSNEKLIIEGLKYFYKTTGAQMVIVTQNSSINDRLTKDMYYKMFDDESHILIVLPVTKLFGSNSVQYYYIGDKALKVIDETGMNRMFENIDNSWWPKEAAWQEAIIDIADLIVKN